MPATGVLDRGRESFSRQWWGDAYAQLSAAGRGGVLAPEDLERLAAAAYLVGAAEAADIWARAFQEFAGRGRPDRAARCGFWLALTRLLNGDVARCNGWLARAQRLLDDRPGQTTEHGYLLVPAALQALGRGDAAATLAMSAQATELGERFRDHDLISLGLLGQGEALIALGQATAGVTLLDEAMTGVTTGEVSPAAAGLIYCSVILNCRRACDIRRAQEWTAALSTWCDSQPDLVPYRGQCLVHRSEILQLRGAWPDALREAERACERLSEPAGQPALGMAWYQLAELCRLLGRFASAERAYRTAHRRGYEPQPGLALLRLAQGRPGTAAAAIRGVLHEPRDRMTRTRMLAAHTEVLLAVDDVPAARSSATELAALAAELGAPLVRAECAYATGTVLLAEADPSAALDALRSSCAAWLDLGAPYQLARARAMAGAACRRLGDEESAELEWNAARAIFQELGAEPDLARVGQLSGTAAPAGGRRLSPREVEVLGLVSGGSTNREIAATLVLSEKTVERHLSNIFTKLGVPNRAAATSYAHEHGLL